MEAGAAGLPAEVILGEVRQSTEASNIARCVALEAGLPETVPGFTVNRLCASAMQATLCGCHLHRDNLFLEVSGGDGGGGPALALHGEGVLLLSGDVKP